MKPLNIVFMGTPQFAVPSLQRLYESDNSILAVITSPDKPAGRGLKIKENPVKIFAQSLNLPIIQPTSLKDPSFIKQLNDLNADIFVVVAFRMLPEIIWKMPPRGTINLHASLLPQYRGAAPINRAIMNGEKTTGLTTFFIEKEIDTGNIIDFVEINISDTDTAGELHDRMMIEGSKLLINTVESIKNNSYSTTNQSSFIIENNELKTAPKIKKEDCEIDFNKNAVDIFNQIRGLSPYPCAFTRFCVNKKNIYSFKIYTCELISGKHKTKPGTIITDNKSYLYIAADDGLLSILELQMEGKKKMQVTDFLKGVNSISNSVE